MNDWQLAEWAEKEPRLKASIMVPCEDGTASAVEIERRASCKHFAQVLLTSRSREPLGQRRYWPIYEAAARNDIPVGVHVGGVSGYPLTAGGWPSFYLEDHYDHTIGMQSLLASFIFEGVFDAFPSLKLVLVESGFGWVPAFTWRMDQHWQRLKGEVPHVRQAPSEYMKTNVWFTTQPVDEPEQRGAMMDLIGWVGADRILFSTDYPHWDFDDPRFAFKAALDEDQKKKIFHENARHVYGLA
jgi:predicted TIM-barrel fold metal-dependent hydrolase